MISRAPPIAHEERASLTACALPADAHSSAVFPLWSERRGKQTRGGGVPGLPYANANIELPSRSSARPHFFSEVMK